MGFGQAISSGFSKYATFRGRASRSEFWWWWLFIWLGGFVASVVDNLFGRDVYSVTSSPGGGFEVSADNVGFVGAIFALLVLLPTLAVSVRRLHDTDHTGWWWWLGFIPCIGWLILIFAFYIQSGTSGENRYGPPVTRT